MLYAEIIETWLERWWKLVILCTSFLASILKFLEKSSTWLKFNAWGIAWYRNHRIWHRPVEPLHSEIHFIFEQTPVQIHTKGRVIRIKVYVFTLKFKHTSFLKKRELGIFQKNYGFCKLLLMTQTYQLTVFSVSS